MRVHVYIDGFNLYYGCLRGSPHRWLDVEAFSKALVPEHDVLKVRYFTARVKSDGTNPMSQTRQQLYLRAIESLSGVSVHYGIFKMNRKRMRLVSPLPGGVEYARVIVPEEKGSDVNLASHLLMDSFRGDYEAAVVVSGDTDLAEPVRMVVQELGKPVHVFNPHRDQRGLRTVATSYHGVPLHLPGRCQLPNPVIDAQGRAIHCPAEWLPPS